MTRSAYPVNADDGAPDWVANAVVGGKEAEERAWLTLAKRLVGAQSTEDLNALCARAGSLAGVLTLSIYHFRKGRRKQVYKLLATSRPMLPPLVEAAHPLFASFEHSTSRRFLPVSLMETEVKPSLRSESPSEESPRAESVGETRLFALRLKREGGVVAVEAADEGRLRAAKIPLRRFATTLIAAAERIAEQEDQRLRYVTLHQLMSRTEEAFATWCVEKGWKFHNPHLLHRLGYRPDQLRMVNAIGHPDAMTAEHWRAANTCLERCIESGEKQSCEYQVMAPDGGVHYFSCQFQPTRVDLAGQAIALTSVSVEMTDSWKVNAEAEANINLEKWLIDRTSQLFNRCDVEAARETIASFGEYFGLDRCIVRSHHKLSTPVYTEWQRPGIRPMSELVESIPITRANPQQDWYVEDCEAPETPAFFGRMCELGGVRASAVLPLRYDSNLLGYIICHSVEPRSWNNRFRRAVRIIADALGMVMSKETILTQLQESRERFQMAMIAASYGLWELNPIDQTIYLSPTYYLMLGYEEVERFDGFRPLIVDNVHIDDREAILDFARGLSDGSIQEFSQESRHIRVNGDVVWILMRGRVVKWDAEGRPTRAMGTLTDVSAMKKSQTDLQLAYQEAESAHVAKSEFLARMSHEIRTPMNAIIGMAYLALQSPLNEEQRRNLHDIDNAAKSLLQIIDDILDFSKIEAQKLTLEYHSFNFYKHMERTTVLFEERAREAGLAFSCELDTNIPTFIRCDSIRLRQVLSNLLSNAIKFTDRGSVSLSVKKESQHGSSFDLVFTVRDTGIGLDEAQIDSLFDPFTQGDGSSTRQYGGTGLGLAISKQLITMMGGDILVCSEPGLGSTFRFSVRCDVVSSIDPADAERSFLPAAETADEVQKAENTPENLLQDVRVLVVEDNKVNQKVASVMLQRRSVKVTVANNGTEAVYMLKGSEANRFDLILMDIEMPYMGGFEATATIRAIERHQKVPIIAMTAHLVDGDKGRYLAAGMDDCISKPITPAALYRVMEGILSKS